jgi:hypothetical protein
VIHTRSDGHLECDMHAGAGYPTWCEHVADFVAKGRDAALIHPVDGTTIIEVPMLPAACDIFQQVVLEPLAARAIGICVIEFELQGGVAFSAGHIMPGEGRGVIRENLIQWMLQQSPEGWGCKASMHGWGQADRLGRMKQDRYAAWLMEQWCMMTTDMCTVCYKKYLDIADVIPKDS